MVNGDIFLLVLMLLLVPYSSPYKSYPTLLLVQELVDLRNQHLPSTYSVLKNSGFLIVLQRATIMSMQQQMNEDTSELVIEASDHNG